MKARTGASASTAKGGEQPRAKAGNGAAPLPELTQRPAPAFHVMLKPRGSICNLDCTYCYYLRKENLFPKDSSFRMSDETLESFTKQYIEGQHAPEVTFAWQGGEPTLMGLDFFKRAVEFQKKYAGGKVIHNSLQTNGTLLDDAWCAFFAEHKFLIGLSVDGPEELHDFYRVTKGGRPSHAKVMEGLALLKKHKCDYNLLCTVHAANSRHPREVYRFLRDEGGAGFMQFIPIVERVEEFHADPGVRVKPHSVKAEDYGRFLMGIYEEWVRSGDIGEVFVQIVDIALAAWMGQPPGLCIFNETCGSALAMEFNGDLFSCDHFVEPQYKVGNLSERGLREMVDSTDQLRFGQNKRDTLPQVCIECPVRFVCNGGCPKNRFLDTGEKGKPLNYLCAGYKAFFQRMDRPMLMMRDALQRGYPASAALPSLRQELEWVEAQAKAEKNRNAPCPCGSGLKVKKCHGMAAPEKEQATPRGKGSI